ncbi:MAG: hypothetical protein K2H14_00665 [Muribaculaceae bacterium]|nr:hypothetical protein [Muribaculaceae bacterium]
MKKLYLTMAAGVCLTAALQGCKTTEENYQRAYEIAKAKKTEGLTAEEVAGFKRETEMPKTVYKGDSIPLKVMYVSRVEGGENGRSARYNVIVASFRQRFNAMSAFGRLKEGGYPGAVLLADKDQRYYVGAVSTASLDSAVTVMGALKDSCPVAMQPSYPYILENAR